MEKPNSNGTTITLIVVYKKEEEYHIQTIPDVFNYGIEDSGKVFYYRTKLDRWNTSYIPIKNVLYFGPKETWFMPDSYKFA